MVCEVRSRWAPSWQVGKGCKRLKVVLAMGEPAQALKSWHGLTQECGPLNFWWALLAPVRCPSACPHPACPCLCGAANQLTDALQQDHVCIQVHQPVALRHLPHTQLQGQQGSRGSSRFVKALLQEEQGRGGSSWFLQGC